MKRIYLVAFIIIMAGCINYTSVTTVAPDGSGTMKIDVQVPFKDNVEFSFGEFDDDYQFPEGWETTDKSIDTLDTSLIYHLAGNFSHPQAIPDFIIEQDAPYITIIEEDGVSRFHFKKGTETFDAEDRDKIESLVDLFTGKHDLSKYYWIEKLVVDGNIVEHNSAERIADTLIWKISMEDLLAQGFMMEAVWEVN